MIELKSMEYTNRENNTKYKIATNVLDGLKERKRNMVKMIKLSSRAIVKA